MVLVLVAIVVLGIVWVITAFNIDEHSKQRLDGQLSITALWKFFPSLIFIMFFIVIAIIFLAIEYIY